MKNRFNFLFLIVSMATTSVLMLGFAIFQGYFSKAQEYQQQMVALESQIQKEKLNSEMLLYQIEDMKQNIAIGLEQKNQFKDFDQIAKNWSSNLRKPASQIDLSGVLFERGKKVFKAGDYDKATSIFDEMIEKYPISPYLAEAYFLKAEGYYLKRDYKNSLAVIEIMVTLFPESELTGFILIRMGQISEINNRTEEALEIYKTVILQFKSEAVRKQAERMIQSIER